MTKIFLYDIISLVTYGNAAAAHNINYEQGDPTVIPLGNFSESIRRYHSWMGIFYCSGFFLSRD